MQPSGVVFYDISDGKEAVPVLCDDHEAAKSFIYAATCPDADFEGQDFFGCDESYGCSCLNGCSDTDDCACKLLLPGTSINMRECGSGCACAADTKGIPCCQNSPVLHGLTCRLAVKKSGSKGLGVFALERIENGRFVCEYAGRRISLEDAIRRTTKQDQTSCNAGDFQGNHNYILIFQEHFADGRTISTCLDPTHVGNVGRFVNHSCGPNLNVHAIRMCGYPHPRVALFAARDIHAGEELAFSYHELSSLSGEDTDRKPCFCGDAACKKWLPFDPV